MPDLPVRATSAGGHPEGQAINQSPDVRVHHRCVLCATSLGPLRLRLPRVTIFQCQRGKTGNREQVRRSLDRPTMAYPQVINHEPEVTARALNSAA